MKLKMLKKGSEKMTINFLNLKLLVFVIFISINFSKSVHSNENYIVTLVNKIPITKVDVINRAKLIAFSVDKNMSSKNLENYYNQSIKVLINEKIIFSAGYKINKNLNSLVSNKANELLLIEFENSKLKLNQFIQNYSIPKTSLLEKYKAQIIWGIILKNKYKVQFSKIERNIEKSFELNKSRETAVLYDLAEIVIDRNNNSKLLKNIETALNNGVSFLDIAKQVSISSSAKFNGKIGWKNFQNLPDFVKRKKNKINEGDVFTFFEKNRIKLINILAIRNNGKLSEKENNILLAQVKFPINFQVPKKAYEKIKTKLDNFLMGKKKCDPLDIFKDKNKEFEIKIIQSRIADLSPKVQYLVENINFFKTSKPFFYGNNGYTYIKCDYKKAKLGKIDYKNLKNIKMNKYFLIYSEKLLKRLINEANITQIEKMK